MWLVLSWHRTLCSLLDRTPSIQAELEQLHWLSQPRVSSPAKPQRDQRMVALPLLSPEGQGRAEPPSRAAGSPRKITHGLRTHSPHSFPSLELVLKSCQKIIHDLSMILGKCLRLPNISACGTKAAPTAAAQGGFLLSLVRMQPNLSKVRHRVGTQLRYGGFGAAGSHHSQPGGAVQG